MANVVKIKTKKIDSVIPGDYTLDIPEGKSAMCVIKDFNTRMHPSEYVTHYLDDMWEWKEVPKPKILIEYADKREHKASENHPFECPYCDSAWAAGEFLEEHIYEDH